MELVSLYLKSVDAPRPCPVTMANVEMLHQFSSFFAIERLFISHVEFQNPGHQSLVMPAKMGTYLATLILVKLTYLP